MAIDWALYAKLGGLVVQGAKSAKLGNASRKEQQEIGELIYFALRRTLCPPDPQAASIDNAVEVLSRRLKKEPVPGLEGRVERILSTIKRVLPGRRPRQLPGTDRIDGPTFAKHLQDWIASTALHEDVRDALSRIDCHGLKYESRALLGEAFCNAFLHEATSRRSSPYVIKLVSQLAANEATRAFRKRTQAESLGRLTTIATASGLLGFGAAQAADLSTPEAALAGVGIAGLAALIDRAAQWTNARVTDEQGQVRSISQRWLARFLSHFTNQRVHANTESLLAGVGYVLHNDLKCRPSIEQDDEQSPAAELLVAISAELQDERVISLHFPKGRILEDLLSGRLAGLARDAKDTRLLTAMLQLDDFVRSCQNDEQEVDCCNIYPALVEVVLAARVPDEPLEKE